MHIGRYLKYEVGKLHYDGRASLWIIIGSSVVGGMLILAIIIMLSLLVKKRRSHKAAETMDQVLCASDRTPRAEVITAPEPPPPRPCQPSGDAGPLYCSTLPRQNNHEADDKREAETTFCVTANVRAEENPYGIHSRGSTVPAYSSEIPSCTPPEIDVEFEFTDDEDSSPQRKGIYENFHGTDPGETDDCQSIYENAF